MCNMVGLSPSRISYILQFNFVPRDSLDIEFETAFVIKQKPLYQQCCIQKRTITVMINFSQRSQLPYVVTTQKFQALAGGTTDG